MTGIIGEGFIGVLIILLIVGFLGPIIIPLFFKSKKSFYNDPMGLKIIKYFLLVLLSPILLVASLATPVYLYESHQIETPKIVIQILLIVIAIVILALIPLTIKNNKRAN